MLVIREEKNTDFKEVYKLIENAFESAEHSDGNEQDLVEKLRKSKNFVKELSLVAELENKIIGYILFTKIKIGNNEKSLAVAPLAVLPEYQRKGIGTKLILEGHRIAKKLGYEYIVVLGSEKYYPKIGYVKAKEYGIKATFDVDDKNFMAIKLNENDEKVNGIVEYAKEFNI